MVKYRENEGKMEMPQPLSKRALPWPYLRENMPNNEKNENICMYR